MHSYMIVHSDDHATVEQPIIRNMTHLLAAYLLLLQA